MCRFVFRILLVVPLVALIAAFAGPVTSAKAELITIEMTGTVGFVNAELTSEFSVGDPFTLRYTFESNEMARPGSTMITAVYDALRMVTITIGSYTATSNGQPEIRIEANNPAFDDQYFLIARASDGLTGNPVNGKVIVAGGVDLRDSTKTAFNNALILPTSLDLSEFTNTTLFLDFSNPDGTGFFGVNASVDSIATVPEPATLALFAISLAGLMVMTARRRRAAA